MTLTYTMRKGFGLCRGCDPIIHLELGYNNGLCHVYQLDTHHFPYENWRMKRKQCMFGIEAHHTLTLNWEKQ